MYEALAQKPDTIIGQDEALRLDLLTQFSELVDGSMRTSFELSFNGSDLIGEDGRSMGDVTSDALLEGSKIAEQNPNLAFEYRRRQHERQEYLDLMDMAKGQGPNTMVVVSDFPEELLGSNQDVGGYNVARKQTMLRVLMRQPDGKILMQSQSLDASNRQALESIYAFFGLKPESGELLAQRIYVDLAKPLQDNLTDRLTGVYDQSLTDQMGGEWYSGRRPADRRNTYDFVVSQHDLISTAITLEKSGKMSRTDMYNLAATMQARFEREKAGFTSIIPYLRDVNHEMLMAEIINAGQIAKVQGKSFSACGSTLSAESMTSSTGELLADSGYGNKTAAETSYAFDKKMHCVVCQPKPKEDEAKKMCGPCGICRNCDVKLKK